MHAPLTVLMDVDLYLKIQLLIGSIGTSIVGASHNWYPLGLPRTPEPTTVAGAGANIFGTTS